jgi:CDP-glycerol glycerophosphotransferase
VESSSDAYPLLKDVDLLVTDYSSIFFDFLLLDRPVVFFSYDLRSYLSDDRQMYFDYDSMTPGPKVQTTSALLGAVSEAISGKDEWKQERERVRNLVFAHTDGNSASRLLHELFPL